MTTAAAVAANRKNAQHSTGPKSAEGKARSSMNALKHGLTAGDVILPNEDPEAFLARLDAWYAEFPEADATVSCLIERAAHASWRLHRCARYETARLTERVLHAVERFDADEHNRAEALGRRLLFEPIDRFAAPAVHDDSTLDKLQRRHDDHPAVFARRLQSFAQGVRWLLARWDELDEALAVRGYWHACDKYKAIRLLGRRPEDVLEDPTAGQVVVACHAADPTAWQLYDMVREAAIGCDVKPVRYNHVEAMERTMASDQGEALAYLRELVADEVRRLLAMLPGLEELDRLDREGSENRAMFDPTEAGTLARRYEAASDRVLRQAIADLLRLKKDRPVPQSAPVAPPEVAPSRNEPDPEPPAPSAVAGCEPSYPPAHGPSPFTLRQRASEAAVAPAPKTPKTSPGPGR